MPVVSDFTIVNSRFRFVQGTDLALNFNTGGRHNSVALLDPELLGGLRSGVNAMAVVLLLNGRLLSVPTVRRWESQQLLEWQRPNIVIPVGRLNSGNNVLVIRPSFASSGDYLFVNTVVVHFHQSA